MPYESPPLDKHLSQPDELIVRLLGVGNLLYGVSNLGHTYVVRYREDRSAFWQLYVSNVGTDTNAHR
jgi:hypothetical protein